MSARFIELYDEGGDLFCVNVDAIERMSTVVTESGRRVRLRMISGDCVYPRETYDEVHAQLYAATRPQDATIGHMP